MNNSKIAFIGAGNMANSLIHGLINKGVPKDNITACDIDQDKLQGLVDTCGIRTASIADAARSANVIVLAVKPQVMEQVCTNLHTFLAETGCIIISIAAGVPLRSLEEWLGPQQAIVRCMPNTPALVSESATGLFSNAHTNDEQAKLAESILSAVGICSWLDSEAQIDMVTALSGSGPAYYFLLMEAMEQAAVTMGLDPKMARQFTIQTALGAAKLAASSDVAPDELRRRVTSPGGTTEAAIKSFESDAFRSIVERAIVAAQKRSIELAS